MTSTHIPFGLNASGVLVAANEVERGEKCNCICPGCKAPLVARKGEIVAPYFAHASGADCATGYESALHLAAKQILEERKRIMLPECILLLLGTPKDPVYDGRFIDAWPDFYLDYDPMHEHFDLEYPRAGVCKLKKRYIEFDDVKLEVSDGDLRPDIVGYFGKRKLYIEVAVTHFADKIKRRKILHRGVSTLEIDLSNHHGKHWTMLELAERIIIRDDGKTWLHNSHAIEIASRDKAERELRTNARKT